jgi:hypothetical protein
MTEELITMSAKELKRLEVLEKLKSKQITQVMASNQLSIGVRQIRRLFKSYLEMGVKCLISKKRGAPSNHQLPTKLKETAISIIKENYIGFGPTLASEYLEERHALKLSVETIRQLMIKNELWVAKHRNPVRTYQQRERRDCFGELVQLDGSHHDWFEGRSDKCCLLVLIDDATGALLGLHFCEAETTQGYFELLQGYFNNYGLPMSIYSDKHGVFRVNHKGCEDKLTQYGRAMNELGIEIIHASTPQAKGRVERANKTLQDRLGKALRIEGISNIKDANSFLPQFMEQYNNKFSVQPKSQENAHCEVTTSNKELQKILSVQTSRKLSKELECSYDNITYQIQSPNKYRLQHKPVMICEHFANGINIYHKNDSLDYTTIQKCKKAPEVHNEKTINNKVDKLIKNKKPYKPAASHPWRQYKLTKVKAQMSVA